MELFLKKQKSEKFKKLLYFQKIKLQILMENPNKNETPVQNLEKIKEQNVKLKSQLRELAKAMDEVIQKEKQKKLEKYKKPELDENLKEKMNELKAQQVEILQTKNKINALKRQLENTYDINRCEFFELIKCFFIFI